MWNFDEFKDSIACIDESGNETAYSELVTAAGQFSRIIKPRTLVFSFCENSPGSLIGYASFLAGRIVPLLLDSGMDRGLAQNLVDIYKPSFIWLPRHMVMPEYRAVFSGWGYSLLQTGLPPYRLHDGLALLVTTSGSTGSPKLVRQSYKNIESNTKSIVEYLEIDADERPITTLPMNYVYGTSIVNSHLSKGATLLLTAKGLVQKEFWRFFKEYGATSLAGVPYTYEMLKKLRFTDMALPSLRTMTQAGGKLHPDLHREFALYALANKARLVIMYGAAEATARMGYLPAEKSLEKCGCMGIAIPGGRFELVDDNGGAICVPGVTGELVYYGDNVMLGYAECGGDLEKGDESLGRYETGDMAVCDADGFYTVVGRKKRFLKIYGNRIGLDETERMLRNAFPDTDCACGGSDDKMSVYIDNYGAVDEIAGFLSEKTGLNRAAFKIAVISKIPRNGAGKILYSELGKADG